MQHRHIGYLLASFFYKYLLASTNKLSLTQIRPFDNANFIDDYVHNDYIYLAYH